MQLPGSPPRGTDRPCDVSEMLGRMRADPRPRLTWYGPDGERVELSGRVLFTWVAKTAHLLSEEADVSPGSTVQISLGPDWRTPIFWLATAHLGAEVVPGPEAGTVDVEIVGEEDVALAGGGGRPMDALLVVVVPRQAVPGPVPGLPGRFVDYGGQVSGFPDELPAPGGRKEVVPAEAPGRRLLAGPGVSTEAVVATLAAGGSVVLHSGLSPAGLRRVALQERVDA